MQAAAAQAGAAYQQQQQGPAGHLVQGYAMGTPEMEAASGHLAYGMYPMMTPGLYGMPQMPMATQIPTGGMMEDEPLYVNAKQYNRILKRRAARAKLEAHLRLAKEKAPYMHESRHRHAMNRPRGPGGRFLTAAEIAELKAKEAREAAESAGQTTNNTAADETDGKSKLATTTTTAGDDSSSSSTQQLQPNGRSTLQASSG